MSATEKILMEPLEELEKRMNAFNDWVEELVERKCKDHCDVIWRELGLGQKNITPFRATALLLILLLVFYCIGYSGSRGPSSLMLEWAYGNRLLVPYTFDFFWHVMVSFMCLSTLDVNIGLYFTLMSIYIKTKLLNLSQLNLTIKIVKFQTSLFSFKKAQTHIRGAI